MWRDIFVTIVQLIVASPTAWKEITKEERSLNSFTDRFLHPLIGIIALATFVGGLWFAREGGLPGALKNTIVTIVALYGGFYIVSYALNETAARFGLVKDSISYRIFTGYASVMIYLLYMIIPFLPDFFILWLLSLYTFYIVQAGATYYLKVPVVNRLNFTLFASALIIVIPSLIRGVFTYLMK
ncbi:MAG: hypothetical protein LLF80_08930 [Porphyromonadaceae bacterium]|nr:hypothetical protein [Porphyromonadaceae bacterium]